MPSYVLPAVQVFQDLSTVPSAPANPLRAHIAGGNAYLARYAESDERNYGYLGYYDSALDVEYAWGAGASDRPYKPAGAVLDESYVKVWIKDALLAYFADELGGGAPTFRRLTGYRNRVYAPNFGFATNGAYVRDASLLDRDVHINDVVRVDYSGGSLWTYVRDITGQTNAAALPATASADTAVNASNQSDSVTAATFLTPDLMNVVDLEPLSGVWSGVASGRISETYTVRVTRSSVGGDLTTALVRLRSNSGDDDADDITPAAGGSYFALGAWGLQIRFTQTEEVGESASAEDEGIPANDLVEGQEWRFTVQEEYTAPVLYTGGAYTGTSDRTYLIEVTRGGAWDVDNPQIRVTTTDGTDFSGPVTVAADGSFAIGTLGLTGYFSTGTGLNLGDRWYLDGEAPQILAMNVLVLGHNLPAAVTEEAEVGLHLFIRKELLRVAKRRVYLEGGADPSDNWTITYETDGTPLLTLKSGLIAYDDEYTDDGEPAYLSVVSASAAEYGQLYVEYRVWRQDLIATVGAISDVANIDDIPGALDPDNPLKWGVAKALENSNGVEVKYTAIAAPDDAESWASMLELLLGRDDVYGLVPLTRDRTVQDLYAAHVGSMSSAEQGLWRVAWFGLEGMPEIPVVAASSTVPGHTAATTSDGELCLCTFTGETDPDTGPFIVLECPAGNGDFVTNGVQPGDIVRTRYADTDGDGAEEYESYVVDSVVNNDELHLVSGPTSKVGTAVKTEVWRTLNKTQESAAIAAYAGNWNNRRIRAVYPETVSSGGTSQEGYFLCCALAGESSGINPHQGMTNLEVLGFDDLSRATRFNRPQLDAMAVAGVWIVTQDPLDGKVFTRHAVTTGDYENVNEREEMLTRNVDSISYRFKDYFKPYIGVTNVTPSMRDLLEFEVRQLVDVLKTEKFTRELGGQLIDAEIVRLSVHEIFQDRYVLILNCTVPYALNVFEVHLVI